MNKPLFAVSLVIIGLVLLFVGLALGFASDAGYYYLIVAFNAIAIRSSALFIFRNVDKYIGKKHSRENSIGDKGKPVLIIANTQTAKPPVIDNAQASLF